MQIYKKRQRHCIGNSFNLKITDIWPHLLKLFQRVQFFRLYFVTFVFRREHHPSDDAGVQ